MRELAIRIAVAQGVGRVDAEARLAAAFPDAEPAKAGDVIGHRRERRGQEIVSLDLRADGAEVERGRVPVVVAE